MESSYTMSCSIFGFYANARLGGDTSNVFSTTRGSCGRSHSASGECKTRQHGGDDIGNLLLEPAVGLVGGRMECRIRSGESSGVVGPRATRREGKVKTFGIYKHSPRGDWQAMYRTRVEPSAGFPNGIALVHIGFAPSFADAVIVRNEWFARVFKSDRPLVTAWNLRARRARKSKKEMFEELMQGQQAPEHTLVPEPDETVPIDGAVGEVLRMLEKDFGDQGPVKPKETGNG